MRCDAQNIYLRGEIETSHNSEQIFTRQWDSKIERDGF